MPSYLDNGFLEDISSEMGDSVDAGGATVALTPAPGDVAAAGPSDLIRIGQFTIKRSTLILSLVVICVVAVYVYSTKKRKRRDDA